MEINREIKNITSAFVLEDNLTECIPYGSGHINDTYRLTYDTGKHYILQKMNRSIFTKPVELMENVSGVTAWLKKKIQENGGAEKKLVFKSFWWQIGNKSIFFSSVQVRKAV